MGRTPTPRLILLQDTFANQILDVTQGRVLRAFGELGPFRRGQLAFEAIQQLIDDLALPFIEASACMLVPEPRLSRTPLRAWSRHRKGAAQAIEKPGKPARDVQLALLRCFENVVIGFALLPDLRRHAVKALRALSERASTISAIARAIRPLPSSNGWMVTNHRCAIPALRTRSSASSFSNHSRNFFISARARPASGAS